MTLGQRIQELRKGAGLSQEGLGEALGVSRQAVSKWESDGGIPELDTLIAMSRFFGITIGELLGVEERPAAEEAPAAPMSEEQVEAVLRRYVEESRQQEPPKKPLSWQLPLAAGCALLVLILVLFVQIGDMKDTISNLRGQLSTLQSNLGTVSGQVSSITDEIRQTLTEEGNLLSVCEYEVVGMDPAAQTVTVRFDATLKDYSAGSKMQFLVDWVKTDQTEGQTVSGFVEGPDFSAQVTIPMNYHAELSIRVEDGDGNIREQLVDYIYSFHPDSFRLEAYNLMKPFILTISRLGSTTITAEGEQACVDILSSYPDIYWPEEAVITVVINGDHMLTEQMTVTGAEDDVGLFRAALEGYYREFTLKEGDKFVVSLQVTDNLGRVEKFEGGGTVNDGVLNRMPMAAPVVRPD